MGEGREVKEVEEVKKVKERRGGALRQPLRAGGRCGSRAPRIASRKAESGESDLDLRRDTMARKANGIRGNGRWELEAGWSGAMGWRRAPSPCFL